MIQNEKFQGDLLLQKTYTVDFLTKERAFNHGHLPQYYVENAHEPILPREVFQIAQGEMLRRQVTKWASNQPAYTCNKFSLSGITRCGCCRAPFRRHMNEYGVRWRCKDGCKQCSSVKEDELHRAVVQAFQKLPEMRESLIRIDERIQAGGIEIMAEKMQNLEKRQDEIKLEIDQLVQNYNNTEAWSAAEPYLKASLMEYYGEGTGEARVPMYNLKGIGPLGVTLQPEVKDASGNVTTPADFVATHYGDWPAPEIFVINTKPTTGTP